MKKLFTAALLNLALISCGSSLPQLNFESPAQQEAYQDLHRHLRGNIDRLVRCGTEEEDLKYEARKTALERALVWNENEHLKEFYLLESGSTLVLSTENNLYRAKYLRGFMGQSKDLTQKCLLYYLPDKMEKLERGEQEYEHQIQEEFKSYQALYRRWERFKFKWSRISAEEKLGDELQWSLRVLDFELGQNAQRVSDSLGTFSSQREHLIRQLQEADEKVQLYRQELKEINYETERLKAGQEEKPRKSLPKYVRTC